MGKLEIIEGKFYRDGKLEAPEIGNQEQINALAKKEAQIQGFKDGFVVEVDYETKITGKFDFECLCGANIYVEMDDLDDEGFDKFVGKTKRCLKCSRDYKFYELDGDLTVKII